MKRPRPGQTWKTVLISRFVLERNMEIATTTTNKHIINRDFDHKWKVLCTDQHLTLLDRRWCWPKERVSMVWFGRPAEAAELMVLHKPKDDLDMLRVAWMQLTRSPLADSDSPWEMSCTPALLFRETMKQSKMFYQYSWIPLLIPNFHHVWWLYSSSCWQIEHD